MVEEQRVDLGQCGPGGRAVPAPAHSRAGIPGLIGWIGDISALQSAYSKRELELKICIIWMEKIVGWMVA